MRVLIFGDSITYGFNDNRGGWAEQLRMDPDFLSLDYTVFPLGIPGDTTEGVLKRFEVEVTARYWEAKSFIVLAIGTNDSQYFSSLKQFKYTPEEFTATYHKLLTLAIANGLGVVVLGIPPIEESKVNPMPWAPESSYLEERIENFNGHIKRLASEQSVPFIDLKILFDSNGGIELLDDGVHPNSKGHNLIYREVKKVLLPLLEKLS